MLTAHAWRVTPCIGSCGYTRSWTETGPHAANLQQHQPAERVAPRGYDDRRRHAVHRGLQQPRALRSHQTAQQLRHDHPGAGDELGMGRDEDEAHIQAPLRRQVARRQAVHGQGRAVHVSPAQRQGARLPAPQSARHLVRAPDGGDVQRRPRGDVQPVAAAAVAARHARLGLHGRLPMPRLGTRHARQADRHGALQVRRVQEQRNDQARQECRLLEEGPALPRRDRVAHRAEPLDAHPRFRRRRVRPDADSRHNRATAQRPEEDAPERDMLPGADQRDDTHAGQPRKAAVRQCRTAPGDDAEPRPAGVHRHPDASARPISPST